MSHSATILIVDDLAANRETLRELLDTPGYSLIEAASGPTALKLAGEIPPDLVLLDIMMPGMGGYEVCRRMRADPRLAEVPIIMVTALDDPESVLTGLEAGADDFLSKPVTGSMLRARVRMRLNRYRRLVDTLRTSEERFRAIFDLVPIAIYSCHALGTIQGFNRRAAELWGREPKLHHDEDRFCGSWRSYQPDGSPISHENCPMAEVLKGTIGDAKDVEVLFERPNGSRFPALVNILPLKNSEGHITGAVNSFCDITDRKQAEAAARNINTQLEQRVAECTAQLEAANRESLTEITDRKRIEVQLRDSLKEIRKLKSALDDHAIVAIEDPQ